MIQPADVGRRIQPCQGGPQNYYDAMGAKETVELFLDLSQRGDQQAADLLHPDVDLTMSMPTIRGKRNVLRVCRMLKSFTIVHVGSIAADGDIVLSERIDRLSIGPIRVHVWVNARFTVQDGRIISWRDYGDPWDLGSGLVRGVLGLLIPALRPKPPAAIAGIG